MTRPARARRNSWCASRSQSASRPRRSAGACIPSHTSRNSIPASTGRRRWARRSSPPATARSKRSDRRAATANTCAFVHADGYETAYGHMTAFARGLEVGSRVRQGQVIGFVGSTGMSTGSHVHFEIHINGRFVNPMTVKLPRGRVLEGPTLAEFERDRQQLDSLMANSSSPRVAQAARRIRFCRRAVHTASDLRSRALASQHCAAPVGFDPPTNASLSARAGYGRRCISTSRG